MLCSGSHTSYAVISTFLAFQGFGIGLTITPAITAGYRSLKPDQINDATPQQNIVQRIGSSIGTAILLSLLQHYLAEAGRSASAQVRAFAVTFGWLLAIGTLALFAAGYLFLLERRQARGTSTDDPDLLEASGSLVGEG